MRDRFGTAVIGAVAVMAVLASRWLLAGGEGLLGFEGSEVYGHAWVQGWVASSWPALASSTTLVDPPHSTAWVVIDPVITWAAAGLAAVVGPVLAYNAMVLAGAAGAYLGGHLLAERIGGHGPTGGVALAFAPIFLGSMASGLTEDLALGLVAVALAGVGRRGWRWAVATGLCLGLLCWMGLYLALMGAVGAVVLGVATLLHDRRRLRELAIAAAIAAILAMPAAMRQGDRLEGVGHRAGVTVEHYESHWRLNPQRGADLASMVVPGWDSPAPGELLRMHPAYLGLGLLGLALLARGRVGRWWLLFILPVLLASGPTLRVFGHPLGLPNPLVSMASELPLLGLVNHWARLLMLSHVALAALAALAVAQRSERWPWLRYSPLLLALEVLLLSPAPAPLPVASAAIAPIFSALDELPAGALLVVPSAGPGVSHQRLLYLQRGHGRALMLHPNRPGYGMAEQVPLVRWFAGLPGERHDPPMPVTESSLHKLGRLGVGVIVVEAPYVDDAAVELGPPDVRAEGGAAWAVP